MPMQRLLSVRLWCCYCWYNSSLFWCTLVRMSSNSLVSQNM